MLTIQFCCRSVDFHNLKFYVRSIWNQPNTNSWSSNITRLPLYSFVACEEFIIGKLSTGEMSLEQMLQCQNIKIAVDTPVTFRVDRTLTWNGNNINNTVLMSSTNDIINFILVPLNCFLPSLPLWNTPSVCPYPPLQTLGLAVKDCLWRTL